MMFETPPKLFMARLMALETPEDRARIYDALEADWEKDPSGAFHRAAREVFSGKSRPYRQGALSGRLPKQSDSSLGK